MSDKRTCLAIYKLSISVLLVSVFTGCGPAKKPVIVTSPVAAVAEYGRSVQGLPIYGYTFGTGPDTVLIIGAIHGNEPAGKTLLAALIQDLQRNRKVPKKLRILILPVCNPDGLDNNTRRNASGIDLNRNFPAGNRINNSKNGLHALSEPESRLLYDLIVTEKPSRILSVHQPYGCIDYDGPAASLARKMGWYSRLPVRRVGSLPGSLGSWAGETMHIPIITLELTEGDSQLSSRQLWEKYALTLRAFMKTL